MSTPLKLQSSGGGLVTVQVPATAANRTVTLPDGDVVLAGGTGAGQVQFPATQNPSTDPNCLDDYEEGTWTPTVTAQTGTFTTVSATGTYTKIGRQVTVQAVVTITNAGTASASVIITLPFTPATTFIGSGREQAATGFGLVFYMGNDGTGKIQKYDGTFRGTSGDQLVVTGTYFV